MNRNTKHWILAIAWSLWLTATLVALIWAISKMVMEGKL